ncbi:type II toxin-antitoxin system PemK/MazF family toxin [Paeniglutamicibacter antarcticus]|uniref:PemK-like, MazF-like toxin of type II toxin-antitoxin system n=1 Tax=Paeniglutamicibacter antarcticus TaxID=494023 RepID=A0ABP9TK75_9MICC
MKFNSTSVIRFLGRALESALKGATKDQRGPARPMRKRQQAPSSIKRRPAASQTAPADGSGSWEFGGYPGDFSGLVKTKYAPEANGRPDPGEIVWAWVPYEEDHSQGKDRPVLLVGRDSGYLLALMLTSKDHNDERKLDRDYVDIGTGSWDRQGRPSEVKVDRVIRLDENGIRREGAILDRQRFALVAKQLANAS